MGLGWFEGGMECVGGCLCVQRDLVVEAARGCFESDCDAFCYMGSREAEGQVELVLKRFGERRALTMGGSGNINISRIYIIRKIN